MQTTDHILMVRPVRFAFNEETASNNAFQQKSDTEEAAHATALRAVVEFDGFVSLLRENGVTVEVLQDTPEPFTPDSIFPNNCFSTHLEGNRRTLVLYPMYAPNRRLERVKLRQLLDKMSFDRIVDLTPLEKESTFLEGTGSLILDRERHLAYACLSPRTHPSAVEAWAREMGYRCCLFHSEDENIIKTNLANARATFGEDIPFEYHPLIRSREACVKSTSKALELAVKHGTRLHVLHISTMDEVDMIRQAKKANPLITAETSANYLWFCDKDYSKMAGKLKCNPAVKAAEDREALIEALRDGTIDTIGSDHAPHLIEEKLKPYLECPSGLPTIQQSLAAVLTIASDNDIPLTRIASAFSERAAEIFGIEKRGFLKPGYKADIIAIDPGKEFIVGRPAYKCGWSPYEGMTMRGSIDMVWVNGRTQGSAAEPLSFRTN